MTNTASEPLDVKALIETLNGPVPLIPFVNGVGGGVDHGTNYRERKHGASAITALTEQLAEMRRERDALVEIAIAKGTDPDAKVWNNGTR